MSNDKPSPATAAFSDLAFTRSSPYGTQAEPTYAGATSFLRRRYSKDLNDVDVAVIGVPFDVATTGRPGTRYGPRAMRAASTMLAWCPPYAWASDPLDTLHVIDWGDVFFDSGNITAAPALIRETYQTISSAGVKPLTLGGDHFISYPILQALAEIHGPLSLIHFDAHSDTWADDGNRIDHGTMFYQAAKTGIVDPSRSIQLGMRTFNAEKHGFEVLDARWLHRHGIAAAVAAIMTRVGDSACYLSFDVDFLDPSCAPGTGTPVVGGFDTHTALELIRGMTGVRLAGADVVEVSPPFDHAEITALAGASIAHEMLGLFAANRK
ncbi:agmatinase [Arenimonas sp.]|jgi:agmatinase|uniref:agmatinase n=1 Tax=Arenimonas sp. TaxID=1872635 RepID=UPI0037BED2F0